MAYIDLIIDKKRFLTIVDELEKLKKKYKCNWFLVSAKTNENLMEAYKQFLMNIKKKKFIDINSQDNGDDGIEIPISNV